MRIVAIVISSLALVACKDGRSSGAAASASASAAPASSGDEDSSPAIELTSPRPRYALDGLSDKQLERMVAKAGWTPTVVGKTPPAEGQSTVRVGAFRKQGAQQLEGAVLVRCRKGDTRDATDGRFARGDAYYRDGDCVMISTVRLGIRSKSAESKQLLESVLAGSAD